VLGDIYRSSNDEAVKRSVIQALAGWQAFRIPVHVARSGKGPDVKKPVMGYGSAQGGEKTAELLRALYQSEPNRELRREIINALSGPKNANVLVALARAEKDPELKRRIVTELSTMDAKEATDYMLEILK
jgi:hypothetical protein